MRTTEPAPIRSSVSLDLELPRLSIFRIEPAIGSNILDVYSEAAWLAVTFGIKVTVLHFNRGDEWTEDTFSPFDLLSGAINKKQSVLVSRWPSPREQSNKD